MTWEECVDVAYDLIIELSNKVGKDSIDETVLRCCLIIIEMDAE